MRKNIFRIISALIIFTALLFLIDSRGNFSVSQPRNGDGAGISLEGTKVQNKIEEIRNDRPTSLKERLEQRFANIDPKEWGVKVAGVKTELQTGEKILALTFDACGGKGSNGYDAKLIEYLEQQHIPATLFVTGQWIDVNRETFLKLAANPLFEIENHGLNHHVCSVNGRTVYNLPASRNVSEAADEIELNAEKIQTMTGRKPIFYRPAGAHTDDVCPRIAEAFGETMVHFNVLGDAGATYSQEQVRSVLSKAKSGSIALLHMNHPEKETAEGIMLAIPELQKQGFRFVRLEDYPLK